MGQAKGDAKVNCPKCGASTKFHNIDGFYDCGSVELGIIRQEFNQSPWCKELCELRSKLTPEGAKPLKWRKRNSHEASDSIDSAFEVAKRVDKQWTLVTRCRSRITHKVFKKRKLAKAYAEELHQKAWREFKEKWGKK